MAMARPRLRSLRVSRPATITILLVAAIAIFAQVTRASDASGKQAADLPSVSNLSLEELDAQLQVGYFFFLTCRIHPCPSIRN